MSHSFPAQNSYRNLGSGTADTRAKMPEAKNGLPEGMRPMASTLNRKATASASPHAKKRTGKVPKSELLLLTSQLAIMCETGVDIAEAIGETARQATHPGLRRALIQVHRDINDGKPIAKAMQRQSATFGNTYVASVAAGESSGRMSEVLNRLAELLNAELQLRSMLKSALAYPAVLASLSGVTLMVLLLFVLPRFGEIFSDLKVPLPFSTECLLALSSSLRHNPFIWLFSVIGCVAAIFFAARNAAVRRRLDYMALNAKLVREVTRALAVGRAFRLVGMMLQSGVPLLEAIQMTRASIGNSVFRELFSSLEVEVLNGRGIGDALAATNYIPGGAARMVVTAEKTGRLGFAMEKVGMFYEADGQRRLNELSKLLEPAIIIAMGALVGGIVLSVMLPMFSMTQMAQMH